MIISLDRLTATVTCQPTYAFLPCTSNIWGQLFLVITYQYLLFLGEGYISAGSDGIFKLLGPGIFGASAFHLLGSLPEAVLVAVSGIYGSVESAQETVVTGMGILAGSTVVLLTLLWATCVVVGRLNLSASTTLPGAPQQQNRFSLTGSGVTTDLETSYSARIIIVSLIPFIIAQIPHIFGSSSGGRVAMLISVLLSLALLIAYCFYQVFQPWIQNRRFEYLMLSAIGDVVLQRLLNDDGTPNTPVIKELFHKFDQDNDKFIKIAELKGLILGIQFEEVGLNKDNFVETVLKEFDTSGDARIDENEFVRGISKWLSETKQAARKQRHHQGTQYKNIFKSTKEEQAALINQGNASAQRTNVPYLSFIKASLLLVFGTAILATLAAPLIDTVQSFATSTNVPSFFISFTVIPFAVNYREAVSAITSIRQKKQQSASLTFSEIYTAVFMTNIVGLAMFLGIVYARGLAWDFCAEVLVVFIICIVMVLFTSFRTTFPLWTSFLVYLLYPLSLSMLLVLNYVFHWA
ncbi:hypothetical protein GIB67_025501 [Kingdonia uniflora]|uniref:EF-hand domain-containing protein n=1 Tax=Kingdonia uniflora TaxID=39325 RepID=A0A7J7PEI8_9MAGN|nr:hypothetical protein GIB67_025501 [Kingdonia uniflora]